MKEELETYTISLPLRAKEWVTKQGELEDRSGRYIARRIILEYIAKQTGKKRGRGRPRKGV